MTSKLPPGVRVRTSFKTGFSCHPPSSSPVVYGVIAQMPSITDAATTPISGPEYIWFYDETSIFSYL
ncbi:uncharacterized protein PG986_004271 [Apiospora aurea]|uniref:Uncharacterized protein n=1 Tax=Apiospora aurea TaxID=335848 RepID=A0ABR1QM45_9PEZI